ncbi:MIOREX complex component 2 [[Candida] jaroonii]|uniref:MIOREX complex component 2 n=1 Tax=[Candida] jaroonii TaxID=467808 RepID=A0ACA9Y7Y0_9ASCO|nr:MIOREX complex component 2 [[Candida] jaroonii]
MSVAVFGGTGFLGSKLCRSAVNHGFKVSSYSRTLPSLKLPGIEYKSADIFDDSTYSTDYDIIIHCVGSMFSNQSYKDIMKNPLSITRMFQSPNPMNKTRDNSLYGINTVSLISLLKAYEINPRPKKKLVYVSADTQLPFTPHDYIRSKRESEYVLSKSDIDSLIIRPGIMYDTKPDGRFIITQALKKGHEVFGDCDKVNGFVRPVTNADDVADYLFNNLDKKLITLEDINSK